MRYEEYPPAPPLAPFVKCIWLLEDPEASAGDPPEPVVPDGSMELVVHFGAPFARRSATGSVATGSAGALAGQISTRLELMSTGPVGVMGVSFFPQGAAAFLDCSVHELRDRVVALEDVWGPRAGHLPEQIAEASGDATRLAILQAFLLARLPTAPPRHDEIDVAVHAIRTTSGRVSVAQLAARLGMGRRRLERGFRRRVGLAPKTLARVCRFQAVFDRVEHVPQTAWAGLAHDLGYYDQAHLIRDFRAFAGCSPTRYLAGEHRIADQFIARS